ncbi:MAG TPA: carboxypeptidase-like regulatory domain-containing protein [Blastocatellia bacterium]|nr:carboxypeptidase-like regulatory domain-containing protein [Blastocatellia bacterium]
MKCSLFSLSIILVAMASSEVSAISQTETGRAGSPRTSSRGTIRGRVTSNDGQPLVNARIVSRAMGGTSGPVRVTSTDEKGEFQVEGLGPGLYSIGVMAPGFVDAEFPAPARYYRPGDTASFTMMKGGVITGTVTNMEGEPVVAVGVRAVRVRDAEGRRLRVQRGVRTAQTDDRGIYRIYGLPPGSYIVMAGGSAIANNTLTAYAEDTPTFFPSATRDTAAEIVVLAGIGATGIDIRYRGEKGHAVSGAVSGAVPPARGGSISVALVNAVTGVDEASTSATLIDNNRAFAFYGVPDGEYEVMARGYSPSEGSAVSPARRITVKGSDVTGVELSLVPSGSISGRVVIEKQADASIKAACKSKRATLIEENLFAALCDEGLDKLRHPFSPSSLTIAPDSRGEFKAQGVDAGRYRLTAPGLGETWYVSSMTLADADGKGTPADVSLNGLSVKSGEKIAGLTIGIAEGAAEIEGRVVAPADLKQLPQPLSVVLVPAEAENKDKLLRYAEVAVKSDGAFRLKNIAPGRYRLIAIKGDESEMSDDLFRPVIWDARKRGAIRSEAELANVVVELKPCQKLADYSLRFNPPSKRTDGTKK